MYTVLIHLMIELLFMHRQINDFNLNRVTVYWWERRGVVGTAWRSLVRVQAGAEHFSLIQNCQTGDGAHTPPYSVGAGVLFRGKAVLHMLRLSMIGAIPLLHLCA